MYLFIKKNSRAHADQDKIQNLFNPQAYSMYKQMNLPEKY